MASEEATSKKLEPELPSEPPPLKASTAIEAPAAVQAPAEKKSVTPPASAPDPAPFQESDPLLEDKPEDTKALAVVQSKIPETVAEKSSEGSVNRDAVLQRVETEKKISLVKAWEESEKSKAENKAHKKLSSIGAWENSHKASIEAELKKIEEKLEMMKAGYTEKMKNKVAYIHKTAEEKKAMVEAKRGEDLLKAEELAAKYCAKGMAPTKKLLGCF